VTVGFALVGARTSPETPYEKWEAMSQERYGVPYRDAEPWQQREIREAEAGATAEMEKRTQKRAVAGDEAAQYRVEADTAYTDINDRLGAVLSTLQPGPEAREAIKQAVLGRAHSRQLLTLKFPEITGQERELKEDDPEWRKAFAAYDVVFKDPRLISLPGGQMNPEYDDILFELLDRFEAEHPEWAVIVDENTNLEAKQIPLYAMYRQDTRAISDSGYWEINDDVVRRLVAEGRIPRTYKGSPITSFADFEDAMRDLALMRQVRYDSFDRWKDVDGEISDERIGFREQNPPIDALLAIWYDRTPRTQEASEIVWERIQVDVPPVQTGRGRPSQPRRLGRPVAVGR